MVHKPMNNGSLDNVTAEDISDFLNNRGGTTNKEYICMFDEWIEIRGTDNKMEKIRRVCIYSSHTVQKV